jgi:hypothetical protein
MYVVDLGVRGLEGLQIGIKIKERQSECLESRNLKVRVREEGNRSEKLTRVLLKG